MKGFLLLFAALLSVGCSKTNKSDVVAQNFYHKYGFEVPEEEWEVRHKNGKVQTKLKNGVTLTENYKEGTLNGPSEKTFPNSEIVQKKFIYDNGVLLKEILFDTQGLPIWEKDFEFEGQVVITSWNKEGTPLSIEEFKLDKLVEGKYFSPQHEEESSINEGFGIKTRRNRKGILLSKETIENGVMVKKESFHPNGVVQSIALYKDLQLHGEQRTYTPKGDLLSTINWNEGFLDGEKTYYKNGEKIQITPYIAGKKQGVETFFDNGSLRAEIQWQEGEKHGSARFYDDVHTSIDWYFKDQKVTRNQYKTLEEKAKIIAEFKNLF